jgi:hypothetical protein
MSMLPTLPWVNRRPRFQSPLPPGRDAVILEPVFRSSGSVRYIDHTRCAEIGESRPAILAGSHTILSAVEPSLAPGVPSHALVVLTHEGDPLLTEHDRDRLWDRFRVPVFEQVMTREGTLIAWECDAHDGFHVAGPQGSECCPCGNPARRVTADDLDRAIRPEAPRLVPQLQPQLECERQLIPT